MHINVYMCVGRERGVTSTTPTQEQICSHGDQPSKEPIGKCSYTSGETFNIDWKNLHCQINEICEPIKVSITLQDLT